MYIKELFFYIHIGRVGKPQLFLFTFKDVNKKLYWVKIPFLKWQKWIGSVWALCLHLLERCLMINWMHTGPQGWTPLARHCLCRGLNHRRHRTDPEKRLWKDLLGDPWPATATTLLSPRQDHHPSETLQALVGVCLHGPQVSRVFFLCVLVHRPSFCQQLHQNLRALWEL